MKLKLAAICPHPPLIVPGVGEEQQRQEVSKTISNMNQLGEKFKAQNVDTVVIITPHGPILQEQFSMVCNDSYQVNLSKETLHLTGDITLMKKINKNIQKVKKISQNTLDHGVGVPLYFLNKYQSEFNIVPFGYSFLSREEHFDFGQQLYSVINQTDKNIAVVSSGDLSHRLTPSAPAGYSEKGSEFDKKLIKLIKEDAVQDILNMKESLVSQAGECGYRSILCLLGLLSEIDYTPQVLSYEGPFGVGYGVINYQINEN